VNLTTTASGRARLGGVAAALAAIGLLGFAFPGAGALLEGALYDRAQRADASTPDPSIVIVSIDGQSTARLGPWPWTDDRLADLLERLTADPDRVVAFASPLPADGARPAGLARLAAALKGAARNRIVLGVAPAEPAASPGPGEGSTAGSGVATEAMRDHARGHVEFHTDADGVVRSFPATADIDGTSLPALPLAITATLRAAADPAAATVAAAVDAAGVIRPRFYGGAYPRLFREVPAWRVLDAAHPVDLAGARLVIVGDAGARVKTPVATREPVAMVMASAVSSLLTQSTIERPVWARVLALLVALGVAIEAAVLLPRLGTLRVVAVVILTAGALLGLDLAALVLGGVSVELAVPGVAALCAGAGSLFARLQVRRDTADESSRDQTGTLRHLAQSFREQGQLELAFETLRHCTQDQTTLAGLYELALEHDRLEQPRRAAAVYEHILAVDPAFRDVAARLSLAHAADTLGMVSVPDPAAAGRCAASDTVVQKSAVLRLARYEIEREIGKGAMGSVYLGRDPKINRVVAIKAIALADAFEEADLAEAKARFFREAEMAGRLNHPGIVTVYDAGEDGRLAYIAMEYLKGVHLSHYAESEHLLDPRRVLHLIARVADALHYAHRQNVVHRDIKPANIMFDVDSDELKITDFGIARLTDTSRTKTGIVLGTPSFMSPEQLEGRVIDGRSDLFALGISLYQLLTGQLPFRAESMTRLMHKIASEPYPPVRSIRPELPEAVEAVLARALAKDPEDRFRTGAEFAAALRDSTGSMAA
jgi:eukaryotic-like serine/threonine-protein kinase